MFILLNKCIAITRHFFLHGFFEIIEALFSVCLFCCTRWSQLRILRLRNLRSTKRIKLGRYCVLLWNLVWRSKFTPSWVCKELVKRHQVQPLIRDQYTLACHALTALQGGCTNIRLKTKTKQKLIIIIIIKRKICNHYFVAMFISAVQVCPSSHLSENKNSSNVIRVVRDCTFALVNNKSLNLQNEMSSLLPYCPVCVYFAGHGNCVSIECVENPLTCRFT